MSLCTCYVLFAAICLQCEKKITPCGLRFSDIFSQTLENLKSIFYTPLIYAKLQIFIQLSPTVTKLCHIKRDYLVHIICSKRPPSAETHAFRRLRKSLISLLTVVCGKSSQICCFYNVNKHVGGHSKNMSRFFRPNLTPSLPSVTNLSLIHI